MRFSTPLLLALASVVAASNVVDLDPSNFDSVIDGSKHALVEFYAPWCGHCKNLAPTYEELADALVSKKDSVVIAKVDADANRDLGSRFDVKGFPTLKWFPKGSTEPEDYNGGRDLDSFLEFIREKTGVSGKAKKAASFVTVLDEQNFDSIAMKPENTVLVEFYAPWCSHCKQLAPIYEQLGKAFIAESNCIVAKVDATQNSKLAEKYGVSGYPTIKLLPADADKKPVEYNDNRKLESFVEFLNKHCGALRDPSGELTEAAGVLEPILSLVQQVSETGDKKKQEKLIASETPKFVDAAVKSSLPYISKSGPYYLRVLTKIVEKGPGYPKKEFERLSKLIEKTRKSDTEGDVSAFQAQLDDLIIRRNVLNSIVSSSSSRGHEEL